MLIDKIFLQEAGSFLVLLHMSMVGQISYCGQKFTCIRRISLPAASSPADQAEARMVWGQAEDSVSTHTESQPFVSLQNRDTEMSKNKRGYSQSSLWSHFWLILAYSPFWRTYPAPAATTAEHWWHDRQSLPVLLQGLIGYESLRDGETSACLAETFKVWNLQW